MKKKLPQSGVQVGHQDYETLSAIAAEIVRRGRGLDQLGANFSQMLRQCVDDVIMTPKTGRRSYEQLEKTEKTYIGTRVEIELRALLKLAKGKLDTVILDRDVDIKNTMGSNWMIPTEAFDQICILVAADEVRSVCFLGVIVARPEYLTSGANKDSKRRISAEGFSNITWILREHAYPPNFWRTISADSIERIFSGRTGNQRVVNLFREVQTTPISRDVIEAVANQKDFMRRIRSDNGRGTRDLLAKEGLLLLSGQYDQPLISKLNLPSCGSSEFLSFRPPADFELQATKQAGQSLH